LRLLLERDVKKEELVYEVSEAGNKFTAVLTIAALTSEKGTEFTGKPATDKKTAEANAAQKALNVLKTEIKAAKDAHDEVQAEKEKARKQAKKERAEARKAEKEAEA